MRLKARALTVGAVAATAAVAIPVGLSAAPAAADHGFDGWHQSRVKHVLLISVDGMHQSDLDWYVSTHPDSELALLVNGGQE
jgi:hypothetical protein